MDWKQFFASVIGSIAWPAVVAVFLYLLRSQLSGLAERLIQFVLFGSDQDIVRDAKYAKVVAQGFRHDGKSMLTPGNSRLIAERDAALIASTGLDKAATEPTSP